MYLSARFVIGACLSATLLLGACSSSENADGWGSVVGPDGEREFRDPADDGFEGVTDEEFVDLDPNEPIEVDVPVLSEPDDILPGVAEELAATAPDGEDGDGTGGADEGDGDGDGDETDDEASPPTTIADDEANNVQQPDNEVHEGEEILDTVEVIDGDPDSEQSIGFRDGNERNELGELVALDSAASLACADIEIALTALDNGDATAAEGSVRSAADRTGESGLAEVRSWAPELRTSADDGLADLAPVLGYLNVCVEGGYEL